MYQPAGRGAHVGVGVDSIVSLPSLRLLGGFELTCGGACVEMPLSARRVLAFLALNRRPLPRGHVAGMLWIQASEARAASALRTAIWRMGQPAAGALRCDGGALSLQPAVDVDLAVVNAHIRAVLDGGPGATDIERLAPIVEAGELLPGWYEDWVLIERERVRVLRAYALERLCLALSHAERHADAVCAGLAAVACDPLRESAHRALVVAHLAHGNAGDALRQYGLCRDLLQRELGIGPSSELERLVAMLRRPA